MQESILARLISTKISFHQFMPGQLNRQKLYSPRVNSHSSRFCHHQNSPCCSFFFSCSSIRSSRRNFCSSSSSLLGWRPLRNRSACRHLRAETSTSSCCFDDSSDSGCDRPSTRLSCLRHSNPSCLCSSEPEILFQPSSWILYLSIRSFPSSEKIYPRLRERPHRRRSFPCFYFYLLLLLRCSSFPRFVSPSIRPSFCRKTSRSCYDSSWSSDSEFYSCSSFFPCCLSDSCSDFCSC